MKNGQKNSIELSNPALERYIKENPSQELEKALNWSKQVNEKIVSLEGMDKPFEGVKEAFEQIKKYCDIAIVSSANKEAILSEWERHGLLSFCNEVMGQDKGSKAKCIASLIEKGYEKEKIIMLGDSPGDYDAAKENNVSFYPIMFGDEKASWDLFSNNILNKFINGEYEEKIYVDKYYELLKKYD